MKREEILLCQCESVNHQLLIRWFDDEKGCPEVYASIYLQPAPFFERLWEGLKYIFGFRSRYGAFDEFIFRPEDADKLQEVVNYLNSNNV